MRKLADLPPEVRTVIVDTIARWRRRQLDRYTRYVLADVCPNPGEHDEWHDNHDETIRRRAKGAPIRVEPGICLYCGGKRP